MVFMKTIFLANAIDATVMAGKETCGLMVGVLVLPASPILYTPEALKAMGPRALGLDMDYQPPRLLKKVTYPTKP